MGTGRIVIEQVLVEERRGRGPVVDAGLIGVAVEDVGGEELDVAVHAGGDDESRIVGETIAKRLALSSSWPFVILLAALFISFNPLVMLLVTITVNTSPTDYYPVQAVQLSRFKGETWELFGDIMAAEST